VHAGVVCNVASACADWHAGAAEAALFVLPENAVASRLYASMGFRSAPYPGDEPGTDAFDYLVAPAERIAAGAAESA